MFECRTKSKVPRIIESFRLQIFHLVSVIQMRVNLNIWNPIF